ncbi:3-hydroxyisobutyryl-CoA hydrolase-like protein 5 [Citrus sinensis]|nr:3-hydroxyisobutyryl-CoA hydrolase-like protein 5 [Citrus sinensis]
MAQGVVKNPDEQVVLGEEIGNVRLVTLNRPRQLNVISSKVVSLLAEYLEKWEKDDRAKLVIVKLYAVYVFSKVIDQVLLAEDSCLEVVYRMYWLCHHIHTYKKTQGYNAGEFLALTGARLNGKELVAAGLATHFVPSEKLPELEKRLIGLNTGDEIAVKSAIEEFSEDVQLDGQSVLNKQSIIDECFSKETVAEIIKSFEAEAGKEGNGWIGPVLKGLKKSSPTGLKITLRSVREGREQSLAECLKKEFRLTINILRAIISADIYEGIRALTIEKDNAPKWDPPTLDKVDDDKVDLVFQPFGEDLELQIPENENCRWDGKYENSAYATSQVTAEAK